jgi:hypothetical protein
MADWDMYGDFDPKKFYLRRVRWGREYREQWQLAWPGPMDEKPYYERFDTWQYAHDALLDALWELSVMTWEEYRAGF